MSTTGCPICAHGTPTSRMELDFFKYGVEDPVTLSAAVKVYRCGSCELEWTDHQAEAARDASVKRHLAQIEVLGWQPD